MVYDHCTGIFRKEIAMKNLPHIPDTNYPNLESNHIYEQYQNEFDYARWNKATQISVYNVPWSIDGNNIVKWDTDVERDNWFKNKAKQHYTTDTEIQIAPGEAIELPIPYTTALTANYLLAEIPQTPGTTAFDNTSDDRIKRIYYFIADVEQTNGSVTKLHLQVDWFTTYQNNFDFNQIFLTRGHAPMTLTTVDEYLQSPIDHSMGLLTDDVKGRDCDITDHSKYIPFGKGNHWAVLAMTCGFDQLEAFGKINFGKWSNPTFSDDNTRYGRQYNVSDYQWGDDYTNLDVPSKMTNSVTGNSFNGHTLVAIRANEFEDFANRIENEIPTLTRSIKAMFILTEDMIVKGKSINLLGHNIYSIVPNEVSQITDLNLSAEDFKYPEMYKDLTKLYTYPYAALELTDNNGQSAIVRIENTKNAQMWRKVVLAYPYLNITAFFSGIDGSGKAEYEWVDIFENKSKQWLANTSFEKYAISYDIPTYALFINGEKNWLTDNYQNFNITRQNALNAYHKAMRSANTNLKNTNDSNQTNLNNTINSTNTSNANAASTVSTSNANANRSADLSGRVMDRTNANTQAQVTNSQAGATRLTQIGNLLGVALQRWDADLQNRNVEADAKLANQTTATNAVGNIISGTMQGGGAGLVSSALGAAVNAQNNAMQINTSFEKVNISNENSESRLNEVNPNNIDQLNANLNVQTKNTQLAVDTNKNNNVDERNTSLLNTAASNNTTLANTTRSNTTTVNNTQATTNLSNQNAEFSRTDVSEWGSKTDLMQTQNNAILNLNSVKKSAPVKIGEFNGSFRADELKIRGVQISIKKMSPDSIREVGDAFKRYGYTFNGWWNITDLNLMNLCTYWQGDLYAQPKNAPMAARENIERIFSEGVTIWSDPDNIGTKDIRTNKVRR